MQVAMQWLQHLGPSEDAVTYEPNHDIPGSVDLDVHEQRD